MSNVIPPKSRDELMMPSHLGVVYSSNQTPITVYAFNLHYSFILFVFKLHFLIQIYLNSMTNAGTRITREVFPPV
jgi:hypothetical protein